MRRLSTLLLAAGLVTSISTASAAISSGRDEGVVMVSSGREAGSGRGYEKVDFLIVGKAVKGMYPGLVKDMKITLTNPYRYNLVIRKIEGRVTASSRRKCRPGPATLVARSYQGTMPLRLPANSKTSAGSIPLFMPSDAPASCQNTTFTVVLTGSGTRNAR